MSPSTSRKLRVNEAGYASGGFVLCTQASNARGAAKVQALALAFRAACLAFARGPSHATRGPLSFRHSLRQVRLGAPSFLASARAAKVNWAIYTDTQVTPAAARPRFPGAGNFRR
jgi:hypothetical protein